MILPPPPQEFFFFCFLDAKKKNGYPNVQNYGEKGGQGKLNKLNVLKI